MVPCFTLSVMSLPGQAGLYNHMFLPSDQFCSTILVVSRRMGNRNMTHIKLYFILLNLESEVRIQNHQVQA